MTPWADRLLARRRRWRLAAILARAMQLRAAIEAALEARRTARPDRQDRARRAARTRFNQRMEGLRQWPKDQ